MNVLQRLENFVTTKLRLLHFGDDYLRLLFEFFRERPRWYSESVGTERLIDDCLGIEFRSLFLMEAKFGLSISFLNSLGSFCRS